MVHARPAQLLNIEEPWLDWFCLNYNYPVFTRERDVSQRRRQDSGDPSIHRVLFKQSRVDSAFDNELSGVLARTGRLLVERGMFHLKLHFCSGQVTLWSMHDPYNYQVYPKHEFMQPGFETSFPAVPYPINAVVPPNKIDEVLDLFRILRGSDRVAYLRSASLNIINGRVGLTFSSDGSQYIDYLDLLDQGKPLFD